MYQPALAAYWCGRVGIVYLWLSLCGLVFQKTLNGLLYQHNLLLLYCYVFGHPPPPPPPPSLPPSHTALSQPDLRAETTASYHTVNFSWSPRSPYDCSSQYELNCTGLNPSTSLYVGEFTPSDQCEYRQFGFQSSTNYNCTVSLTSSESLSFPLTVSLTTLGQCK